MTTRISHTTFDLENIWAVTFRCKECHTLVSFPRIRWANFPGNCPNCGARWMSWPNPDGRLVEDSPMVVLRAVRSFREALQTLIGLGSEAGFAMGFEMEEATVDPNVDSDSPTPVVESHP